MYQNDPPYNYDSTASTPEQSPMNLVQIAFAALLLGAGLIMAFWVFWQVYTFFTNPEEIKIIGQLSDDYMRNQEYVNTQFVRFYVPEMIVYGIPLLLLSLIAKLAISMITGATNLLQGDWQRLKQQLTINTEAQSSMKNEWGRVRDEIQAAVRNMQPPSEKQGPS